MKCRKSNCKRTATFGLFRRSDNAVVTWCCGLHAKALHIGETCVLRTLSSSVSSPKERP